VEIHRLALFSSSSIILGNAKPKRAQNSKSDRIFKAATAEHVGFFLLLSLVGLTRPGIAMFPQITELH